MGNHAISTGDAAFSWQELEERIGDYLRDEGIPSSEAGRLSHAVIRRCADAADSIDRDRLRDSAMDEAQTLLATWQAARRENLLAHA